MATVLSANRRSAPAALGGCRNAKHAVDFGPHLRGAGPDPIAPSTFSRTRSAPARNGLSDGAMLSGSGRMPNECQSVSAAERAHLGSRLVPSVTSPPAQTLNGAESGLGLVVSASVEGADCPRAIEPTTRIVNESADDPAFTAVRRKPARCCQRPNRPANSTTYPVPVGCSGPSSSALPSAERAAE